jgi:hypothetical protein
MRSIANGKKDFQNFSKTSPRFLRIQQETLAILLRNIWKGYSVELGKIT